MRPLLFVLGVALAAGAEAQVDTVRLLVQSLAGVALIWAALMNPSNEVKP